MYKFIISDTNKKQNIFLVFLNLILQMCFTYKFIIPHIKKKKNNFIFLKCRPSSYSFNKLVIKSKNTCKK